MKLCITFLLAAFLFAASDNAIFTEDVFVKDFDGKVVNLKNIEITKDTVMIYVWCRRCSNCAYFLDKYSKQKAGNDYQIISIILAKGDSIDKEKKIISQYDWPFETYYDNYYKQNITEYLVKKGYTTLPKLSTGDVAFTTFPNIFIFAKGKLICNGFTKCNDIIVK